jgi:hypothetical protein
VCLSWKGAFDYFYFLTNFHIIPANGRQMWNHKFPKRADGLFEPFIFRVIQDLCIPSVVYPEVLSRLNVGNDLEDESCIRINPLNKPRSHFMQYGNTSFFLFFLMRLGMPQAILLIMATPSCGF